MGTFIWGIIQAVYVVSCFALIFLVLIQESKGEGLSGVFGGGGGSQTLFGSSAPTVVHKFTIWCAVGFMGLGFLLMFHTPTRKGPATDLEGFAAPPAATSTEDGAVEESGDEGAPAMDVEAPAEAPDEGAVEGSAPEPAEVPPPAPAQSE
jgi:preprotein translocase subunit SecG